jgi:hypothetical protein
MLASPLATSARVASQAMAVRTFKSRNARKNPQEATSVIMPTTRDPTLNTAGRLEAFDPSVLASRARKL